MRWLVARDLTVIARTPGFWAAMAVLIVGLGGFLVIWGGALPIHGAGSVFEQFLTAQTAFLSILLPWTALRCGVPAGRSGVAAVAAAAAVSPARVVFARCLALGVALALLVTASLPLTIVAQQIAARPFAEVVASLPPMIGLGAFAAVAATAASMCFTTRLGAWVAATAVMVAVVAVVPIGAFSTIAYATLAVAGAALAAWWADGGARYLSEDVFDADPGIHDAGPA